MSKRDNVRTERRPGHFWADNEVIDNYAYRIGPHAFCVYMYLCRIAGNRTGESNTTCRQMAEGMGMSVGSVHMAVKVLIEHGLIRCERKAKSSHGCSTYTLSEVTKNISVERVKQVVGSNLGQILAKDKNPTVQQVNAKLPLRSTGERKEGSSVQQVNTYYTNTNTKANTVEPPDGVPTAFRLTPSNSYDHELLGVWEYYLSAAKRDPAIYKLTEKRRQAGMARLAEAQMMAQDKSVESGAMILKIAIQKAAKDPWHNGQKDGIRHMDWIDHLFKTQERFQKVLSL